MSALQVVRELKRDALGRIELLDGPDGLVVRRVASGGRVPGSRPLARVLLARERRALRRLEGVTGVARVLDPSCGADAPSRAGEVPAAREVLLRSWIEGCPLHAATELPSDFFERLEDLVRDLHARGVCHNDLHKEGNVLVCPDGYPALVDFQLASLHRSFGGSWRRRAREDLRHVAKHRRVYALGTGIGTGRPETLAAREQRAFVAAVWMRLGKPVYNLITRRFLRTQDGEPRRPPGGPWPEWTAPVGPRDPA